MYRKLILLFLIFIAASCSPTSEIKYGSSYKFLEHGDEYKHTPQELYQECLKVRSEINVLKAKAGSLKGPGYSIPRKQIEADIEWLSGKYKEADCDNVISSPPQPSIIEEKSDESQPASHEHKVDEAQPAVKDVKPDTSFTFDECFKKCKELTSRTNEECFDACLHH